MDRGTGRPSRPQLKFFLLKRDKRPGSNPASSRSRAWFSPWQLVAMDCCHGARGKYRAASTLPLTVRRASKARPELKFLLFALARPRGRVLAKGRLAPLRADHGGNAPHHAALRDEFNSGRPLDRTQKPSGDAEKLAAKAPNN